MKSFIAGLLTIVALGVVGFYTFKATTKFMNGTTPTPSSSPSASVSPTPTPSASAKPKPDTQTDSGTATTKGGEPIKTGTVKGATTTAPATRTTTTTTTTSHLTLTLVKTSICPISYTTEVKDIKGPLTLRYKLIDNTSFGITVWNSKGEELLQNTTYSGNSGTIKTISGVDYMKVRVESKTCAGNNDNWLTLTAER
jgi:cytoskeletal protein RodZ